MLDDTLNTLLLKAKEIANSNFCCNHSNFTVGAALLTKNNIIYTGFNVENQGIQSICAERVVFSKAFTNGSKDFECIFVVGRDMTSDKFIKTLPCGYCRQFMSEYVSKDFKIYTYDDNEQKLYSYTLSELLPEAFES